MRSFSDEEFMIWYFESVRSVLILEKELLPEEADKVLAVSQLARHIRTYLEDHPGKRFHDDPHVIADAIVVNAISNL